MSTSVERPADTADGNPQLARKIGRRGLLLFVIGDILGAGIYSLTGKVAGEVGGALWVPFLCAFVLAALTATAYVELVGKYPKAAGAALYANKAFGLPFLTFMIAFAVGMSGITSAASASRAFGGDYLAEFIDLPTVLVAFCFLALVTAINFIGVSESIRVNIALTIVELTGLLVIIAIGAFALLSGDGEPSRAMELNTEGSAILGILGGTALAFYALLGFEDSVNMVEETKDPDRDFPRALFGGLAFTGCIYLLVAFTATMLVDVETLSGSTGPLLEVVKVAGFDFPPKLFALIALFAVANTALINLCMASRLMYGMSGEHILPKVFATVHPRRQTPWVAIVFVTLVAAVLVTTGDIGGLADTTVLLLLIVFAVVNISVLVLRRDEVDRPHFRAPTWMPALGLVACVVLATPLTGREGAVYLRAGILLAIGVALWFVNRIFSGRSERGAPDPAKLAG